MVIAMVFIRPIQSTDWQGLYDLINQVDKTLVGMYASTKELVEDWISTIEDGIWEVHVAILPLVEVQKIRKQFRRKLLPWKRPKRSKSRIVGVVTLYGDWKTEEDIEEGDFDIGITVEEPFQRKGIGKELLLFIIERGLQYNYKRATLWTREDNLPMIKLAKKSDFKVDGNRKRHGFNWIQYVMELKKEEEKS
jgi:RimJ/RimL family protein N-acetyltransferase